MSKQTELSTNQNPYSEHSDEIQIMTTKEWMLVYLLMCIPVANIVLLTIWSFDDTNMQKRNWSRAQLIWMGILIGIIVFVGFMMVGFATWLYTG